MEVDVIRQFRGISRKMAAEFEDITSQIPHMGDRGGNREQVIRNFLQKHLPGKFAIGTGQAISADGQISKQLDAAIYARASCPLWFNEHTQIFPVESVCGVVEIKSTIDTDVLQGSAENIRSIRRLPKLPGARPLAPGIVVSSYNPAVFGSVFAYAASTSLETLRDKLNSINITIPPPERICLVCVLNEGILINVDTRTCEVALLPSDSSVIASVKTGEDALLLFFLLLSSYLNSIEVIPPNLSVYASKFLSHFRWETRISSPAS